MLLTRRKLLHASAALAAATLLPKRPRAAQPQRIVIVGGGWGGLAAACHLRQLAPAVDVVLVEKQPSFWSCPLSNKWLTGQVDGRLLAHRYEDAANALGYRFIHAEATAIDREGRQVVTTAGTFDYDRLILSVGIRHDYTAWFGDDAASIDAARRDFPAAYTSANEFHGLRDTLQGFRGGDLLMTVPPAPYRCPPAPFERALLLAGWFEARKVPARITLIDPNPPSAEFQRLFRDRFAERIIYRSQTPITGVDLRQRTVKTEFEDFPFDHAILMPPQQAGDLVWQAGLIAHDRAGNPTGWAAVDPLRLTARSDPRIHLIGDMVGAVSALFGHYPKSAQLAVRQGRIVARQIAALASGSDAVTELPDSLCHIATAYAPPEAIRITASFRQRGDGELMQQNKVERDPQPRGEDLAWLNAMLRETLIPPG